MKHNVMRTNEIFKSKMIAIFMAVAIISIFGCAVVSAQIPCAVPVPAEEWLPAGFYPAGSPEAAKLGYQPKVPSKSIFRASAATMSVDFAIISPLISLNYQGNSIGYTPPTSWSGSTIINPVQVKIWLDIPVGQSVNTVYSLYTYKSTFPQDNKRVSQYLVDGTPSMQAVQECGTVVPPSTQADLDNNFDKIYEFPVIREDTSGLRVIDCNGKTSSGMAVRDCVLVAAHNKDTGKLLGLGMSAKALESYTFYSRPGVEFTAGTTAVSAKITLAYEKPVRRIWAILVKSNCTTGSGKVTFGVVNKGGEAIAAGMNQADPGAALAVTELKNPVLDLDGVVKIFTWDNITGFDGKPVLPPDQKTQYMVLIDVEGDDGHGNVIPTFTGLNDGYLLNGGIAGLFPMPTNYTGIQNPAADNKIVVETTPDGFIIDPKGNFEGEWMLTSTAGVKLTAGKGSFVSKSGLPQGVYFLTVSNSQGVKETHKVIVR